MKQVRKTRKIRKTFVNLLNFCIGKCGIRSWRFSERFKQANLQFHWLSKIACSPTTNEITNSLFELREKLHLIFEGHLLHLS